MTQRENERISAYLDGELTDSERSRVESDILDDSSHQSTLAQFQQMGDRISHLPKLRLGADFHQRVLAAAADAQPAHAEPSTLGRRALVAVATLTAVVALIVVSTWREPVGLNKPGDVAKGLPQGNQGSSGTSINVSDVKRPQYVFIFDVSVSIRGQKSKPVEAILKQQEIFFDKDLRPTEEVEQNLLNSQFVGKFDARKPGHKARLIYVEMNVAEVNEVYQQLKSRPREVDIVKFNFSKQPKEMHIFEQLRRDAASQIARSTPRRRAWRIDMGVPVQSTFVIGAGSLPLELLKQQLLEMKKKETPRSPATNENERRANPQDAVKRPILFIIHPTPRAKAS